MDKVEAAYKKVMTLARARIAVMEEVEVAVGELMIAVMELTGETLHEIYGKRNEEDMAGQHIGLVLGDVTPPDYPLLIRKVQKELQEHSEIQMAATQLRGSLKALQHSL